MVANESINLKTSLKRNSEKQRGKTVVDGQKQKVIRPVIQQDISARARTEKQKTKRITKQ